MAWARGVIFVYALLDVFDGVQGYATGGKLPWLMWNVGFGLAVAGGLALAVTQPRAGYAVCALFAALDTVFFGRKLALTGALWPAGVVTVVAAGALVCAIVGLVRGRRPS